MFVNELNIVDFEIKFCGMDLDWDDFEDLFEGVKKKKIIKKFDLKYI